MWKTGSRASGTNPRALKTNPRSLGVDYRSLGLNPRALGISPSYLRGIPKDILEDKLKEIPRVITRGETLV